MQDTSTDRFSRKSPRPTHRVEHVLVVAARERVLDEAHAVFLRDLRAGVVGRDDGDLVGLDADVAQDQRQYALADAAEADDY